MRVWAALGLGVVGLVVGMVVNVLIERIPEKSPLRPLGLRLRPGSRAAVLVVQLACGLLWAAATLRFGADWALPAFLVFFTSLLTISVIDFDLHIIPNRLVYPTIFVAVPLLALAAAAEGDWGRLRQALIGATLAWLGLLRRAPDLAGGDGVRRRPPGVRPRTLPRLAQPPPRADRDLPRVPAGGDHRRGPGADPDPQPQGRRALRAIPRRRAPSWPSSSASRSSAPGSGRPGQPASPGTVQLRASSGRSRRRCRRRGPGPSAGGSRTLVSTLPRSPGQERRARPRRSRRLVRPRGMEPRRVTVPAV